MLVRNVSGFALAMVLLVTACGQEGGRQAAGTAEPTPAPSEGLGRVAASLPQAGDSYYVSGLEAVMARAGNGSPVPRAKNVIIFVGDGMGISTVTAGRIYVGQKQGLDGESYRLAMDTLPYAALSKTYSHDTQVPDSASTATAMFSGVKTRSRMLGLTQDAAFGNCATVEGNETATIFELAEAAGMATGIVSTARITHATPGAAYAKTPHRDWESDAAALGGCPDIARQMVEWSAGNGFEVMLGGGRSNFFPESVVDPEQRSRKGTRTDERNLVEEWLRAGNDRVYVTNLEEFRAVDFGSEVRVLGLFEPSHMQYELDRQMAEAGPTEPSLADLTEAAIRRLSRDEDGFILLIEAGRIDHAHHGVNAARALEDLAALDLAIARALELTDSSDTLIIVTADHSHTLTMAGYPRRNNPILGKVTYETGVLASGQDGKPYTTLGYANGQSACRLSGGELDCERQDLSEVDTTAPDFRQPALVPMPSETHAGEDVAILASGPGAELIRGVMEQNEIFHVMGLATGLISGE